MQPSGPASIDWAGSGGSYGFSEFSEIARAAEHLVGTPTPPGEADKRGRAIQRLESVLAIARARMGSGAT